MARPGLAFVAVILATGCNSLFGVEEGKPRPVCVGTDGADPLIDDMEDGDGFICDANGRHGHWYTVSDESSIDLMPAGRIDPTPIPGRRGNSQYAAHIAGAGFTSFVGMAFDLNQVGLSRQTFDASGADGIKFWMKSTTPVEVELPTPETLPPSLGGECADTPAQFNCFNPFSFQITAPSSDWVEYEVPFAALKQFGHGGGTWNPRNLYGAAFFPALRSAMPFELWIDDVRFYTCAATGCRPTCSDPAFPMRCPARGTLPARCTPPGSDCSAVGPVGCDAMNTDVAPSDGLITSFVSAEGIAIAGPLSEAPLGLQSSAPTVTTDGALRIKLNAPVQPRRQVFLVDFAFQRCIDASAFTGVQFTLGGSVSGCQLSQATQDSAHLYGGEPGSPAQYGSGQDGSRPNATVLTVDQISSAPQTVMIPFAAQTGGIPETPTDKSKLTFMDWVFIVEPAAPGGPNACVADLTIDDVRFF